MSLATYAAAVKEEMDRLWVLACKRDKIDPASRFASFSPSNRAAREYNLLAGRWQAILKQNCVVPR